METLSFNKRGSNVLFGAVISAYAVHKKTTYVIDYDFRYHKYHVESIVNGFASYPAGRTTCLNSIEVIELFKKIGFETNLESIGLVKNEDIEQVISPKLENTFSQIADESNPATHFLLFIQ